MPRLNTQSRCDRCGATFKGAGLLCPACKPRYKDTVQGMRPRRSPSKRGYDHTWRKVRAKVLAEAGIPPEQWPLYDVDHNPPYNPGWEPDHTKYTLIPRLHDDHSSKTAQEDNRRNSDGKFRGKGGNL